MRFKGGICPEKSRLDQIQNGQPEAINDFIMDNIGENVPDI